MTEVIFHTEASRIVGFEAKGHSGYAEEGEDIVCAAVTSAVRLTECTINDVLGLEASVKVREKDASITLKLPAALGQTNESTCQGWMKMIPMTMMKSTPLYPMKFSTTICSTMKKTFNRGIE